MTHAFDDVPAVHGLSRLVISDCLIQCNTPRVGRVPAALVVCRTYERFPFVTVSTLNHSRDLCDTVVPGPPHVANFRSVTNQSNEVLLAPHLHPILNIDMHA